MKISSLQEYGLRCVMQCACHTGKAPLTVKEIARREFLTPVYVAKILVRLRRAGLVTSVRGVQGGYRLARPAREISLATVLGALGRVDLGRDFCRRYSGTAPECAHIGNCGIRPVWATLNEYIFGFLNQLTLEQLVQDEDAVTQEVSRLKTRAELRPPRAV